MPEQNDVLEACTKVNSIVFEWQTNMTGPERNLWIQRAPPGASGFYFYLQSRLEQLKGK